MFQKMLVCSDGSENALQAVRTAADMAAKYGAQVLLLNVFDTTLAASPMFVAGIWELTVNQEAIDQCMAEIRKSFGQREGAILQEAGVSFETRVAGGHPAETIVQTAAEEKADLIVMGSRGLSGIKSFFMGSVSHNVLHHAACSVLIVR